MKAPSSATLRGVHHLPGVGARRDGPPRWGDDRAEVARQLNRLGAQCHRLGAELAQLTKRIAATRGGHPA